MCRGLFWEQSAKSTNNVQLQAPIFQDTALQTLEAVAVLTCLPMYPMQQIEGTLPAIFATLFEKQPDTSAAVTGPWKYHEFGDAVSPG
jgi:hypothetical protein